MVRSISPITRGADGFEISTIAFVDELRGRPACHLVRPGPHHWDIFVAPMNGEVDTVHGLHRRPPASEQALTQREVLRQAADFKPAALGLALAGALS